MPALTSIDPQQFFNLRQRSDTDSYRLDTNLSDVTVSSDFSGHLSVMTAEGDRVTLTADLETDFRSVGFQSRVKTNQTTKNVETNYTRSTFQQHVGIAVDGDLNQEELRDLDTLFQKVSNIFRGFFHGQDENAHDQTTKLAEGFRVLDSLAGLDLRIDVLRSVAVVAASSVSSGGAPATGVVIPQSSTGTTAPTPSSHSPDGTDLTGPENDTALASLIRQLLDALKEANVESDNLRKYFPKFLERLREDWMKESRGEHALTAPDEAPASPQGSDEVSSSPQLIAAYRTVTDASIFFSIHS
ncbi:MAG: hypothetical protein QM706_03455 [Nitrospira sp.]